jgi:hypothetical protein
LAAGVRKEDAGPPEGGRYKTNARGWYKSQRYIEDLSEMEIKKGPRRSPGAF